MDLSSQSKNEIKKTVDKYLDFARWKKKSVKHVGDSDTDCNWRTWNGLQSLEKRIGAIGKKNRDHSDFRIVENGQNIQKIPEDWRKLAATQTTVKAHQIKLMWKTRPE